MQGLGVLGGGSLTQFVVQVCPSLACVGEGFYECFRGGASEDEGAKAVGVWRSGVWRVLDVGFEHRRAALFGKASELLGEPCGGLGGVVGYQGFPGGYRLGAVREAAGGGCTEVVG